MVLDMANRGKLKAQLTAVGDKGREENWGCNTCTSRVLILRLLSQLLFLISAPFSSFYRLAFALLTMVLAVGNGGELKAQLTAAEDKGRENWGCNTCTSRVLMLRLLSQLLFLISALLKFLRTRLRTSYHGSRCREWRQAQGTADGGRG